MVTPYFALTCCAGKLSKVHMPSSAKAGGAALNSKLARRNFFIASLVWTDGVEGRLYHAPQVYFPLTLALSSLWGEGIFSRKPAIVAPFGGDRVAGLATMRSSHGEAFHRGAKAFHVGIGNGARRSQEMRLMVERCELVQRERRHAEWRLAAGREEEALMSELFLAQWRRKA